MRNSTELSAKQERFALAFAQHHNASLACREAGYSAHGRSASVTGTRLFRFSSSCHSTIARKYSEKLAASLREVCVGSYQKHSNSINRIVITHIHRDDLTILNQ